MTTSLTATDLPTSTNQAPTANGAADSDLSPDGAPPKKRRPRKPREPHEGYTIPELAGLLRKRPSTIRGWIRSGQLPALNLATRRGGRPRLIILPHHLTEFEKSRRAAPPKPPRRRRTPAGQIDFYPDPA
jgi:hypothetical protein